MTKMKEMWQTMKEYFGDGFTAGTAPLGYTVHCCNLRRPEAKGETSSSNSNGYGVGVDENAMPLFSVLGDTCAPSCSCHEMQAVVRHIDAFLATAPDRHVDDYAVTTGKNDDAANVDTICLYTMRDTLSWWAHWTGRPLRPADYWKHVYVAFAAVPDDLQLPPADFIDGSFRFLGPSWSNCRDGLLGEGVAPDQVKFAEMCLWRQMITQYVEKVVPALRLLLVSKTTLMTQYRVHTANALGYAVLYSAADGRVCVSGGLHDEAVEMASIAQCLSMDMAKEALGVLEGEKTETVAGYRVQLKRELRWTYVRCLEYLEKLPDGAGLRRFASAGLHYVPMMDRYLERVRGNTRFPISDAMGRIFEPFVKRPPINEKEDINGYAPPRLDTMGPN